MQCRALHRRRVVAVAAMVIIVLLPPSLLTLSTLSSSLCRCRHYRRCRSGCRMVDCHRHCRIRQHRHRMFVVTDTVNVTGIVTVANIVIIVSLSPSLLTLSTMSSSFCRCRHYRRCRSGCRMVNCHRHYRIRQHRHHSFIVTVTVNVTDIVTVVSLSPTLPPSPTLSSQFHCHQHCYSNVTVTNIT